MTTKIKMTCDGCDAEHTTDSFRRTFQSFSGRGYGFGTVHTPTVDEVVDGSGWVWSDPYTYATYCPECWASIERGEAAE